MHPSPISIMLLTPLINISTELSTPPYKLVIFSHSQMIIRIKFIIESFLDEFTAIAGVPANVVKKAVKWDRKRLAL